jgi:hypothetical protein
MRCDGSHSWSILAVGSVTMAVDGVTLRCDRIAVKVTGTAAMNQQSLVWHLIGVGVGGLWINN